LKTTYEFEVKQISVSAGVHSWEAIETSTGRKVDLREGGQEVGDKNLVGQYPEIEDYLLKQYGIHLNLFYVTQLDRLTIYPNGHSRWIFNRSNGIVVVNDIPRVVFSVSG
jgi:hypothetical protein